MFCVYFMVWECVGVEGSGGYRWSSGDTVGACSQVDARPGSPGLSAPKQPRRSGVADPSRLHLTMGRRGARSHPGTSRGKDAPPAVLAVSARPLLVPGLCSSASAPPGPPAPPAPIRCCPGLQSRHDGCQHTRPPLCLINPQAVSKTPSYPPSPALPCHPGAFTPGFSDSASQWNRARPLGAAQAAPGGVRLGGVDSVTLLLFSAAPLVGRAAPTVASGAEQGDLGQGQWEVPQGTWSVGSEAPCSLPGASSWPSMWRRPGPSQARASLSYAPGLCTEAEADL